MTPLPPITREQELQLLAQGTAEAKAQILRSNLRLLAREARRYSRDEAEVEDLLQDACIGFLHGIEAFDSSRGTRVSTYALLWARSEIQTGARRMRGGSPEAHGLDSLDLGGAVGEDGSMVLEEVVADEGSDAVTEAEVLRREQAAALERGLRRGLREREQLAITKYFSGDGVTLMDVARELGCSHEGVRHLHLRALPKLRRNLEAMGGKEAFL